MDESDSGSSSPGAQQVQAASEGRTGRLQPAVVCSYGQRLGFAYFDGEPAPEASELNSENETTHYFTIDNALVYLSFFKDWGPLHCASFYRFSLHLHSLLEDTSLADKKIMLFSSKDYDKKANAALLMSLYAMIVLRWSPAEALHPISDLELRPFRDAGYARADFHLALQDCLFGIKKAVDLRLLKLDEFDVREYETFEKVENGDWNLITPHFLAFASPSEPNYSPANPESSKEGALDSKHLPKTFRLVLEQFQAKNVKTVIRLNKKLYNARHFVDRNMRHVEMFYEDGTNPTLEQVRQFIDISEETIKQGGVVAVHCKAGLGRTGTLIGAYMIYKWGFTASEAIAFQRFMRPGCVVGPQQHYLYANQHTWVKWAAMDSVKRSATPPQEPVTTTQAEASSKAAPTNSRSATPPPQTEGHPNAPVPGQPRKTPGAKSRHGIALPETNDEGETEAIMVASTSKAAAQDDEDSNMECVDTQRQQDAIDSQDDSGMEVDEEPLSTTSSRPPPPAQPKSSTRPPSRIAKSKSPLTTNLDNRQASMHTSRPASSSAHTVPRSKGARNLGLLSDHNKASLPSASTRHTGSSANGPSDRYNLRQASRSGADAPTSPKATSTAPPPNAGGKRTAVRSTRPTAPQPAAQSPSKLPTATGSKRKGATSPSQPAGRTLSNPKGDLFTDSSSTNGNKKTRLRTRPVRTTNMDRSVRAAA